MTADELKVKIGAVDVVVLPFDGGTRYGVAARMPDGRRHAVKLPVGTLEGDAVNASALALTLWSRSAD